MREDIIKFINIFQSSSTKELFTECACYWFAHILHTRFRDSIIVYDPDSVHFATKIGSSVYDITGELEDASSFIIWSEEAERDNPDVVKECIFFGGGENELM